MALQQLDGIVQSVRDIRSIFSDMTDEVFIEWYSKRFMVTPNRVQFILEQLKGETV